MEALDGIVSALIFIFDLLTKGQSAVNWVLEKLPGVMDFFVKAVDFLSGLGSGGDFFGNLLGMIGLGG